MGQLEMTDLLYLNIRKNMSDNYETFLSNISNEALANI